MKSLMAYLSLPLLLLMYGCQEDQKARESANEDDTVVVTKEQNFDYLTWKIETANGAWHFEIEHADSGYTSTGFSSAIDREGNDWIGNNCVDNREWRGWPNFGPDGFGHPCRGGGGTSQWVDENGNPVEFEDRLEGEHLILESWNDNYRVLYHFFPSHAAIEVLEARQPYAFLFEGPIAGQMDIDQQHYVLEDGVNYGLENARGLGYLNPEFGNDFPSPFFYFTDEEASQILYVGAKGHTEGGDEGWAQPDNMVIFSYGRDEDEHALTGTDGVAVFGFLDKEMGHEQISDFINARLENPFKSVE
ncbi:hypothetical protein NC796_00975 [Aliifodinibius sp. S!AR15-10]|uniref:hypothetical protein n=1 Tax=Aliifodinibius sp. S!AR15-10 TaxID=2950437 RepID=UPI0028676E99|nr:hypothetical protein [Aliifodinibius sp. S!AR15-10]MDR8389688.1 hypothetical protein [Aliifodinibius sp. S!AR15-10]